MRKFKFTENFDEVTEVKEMEKKKNYYNCFSPNLLAYLLSMGFVPYEQLTHDVTKKHFWRFEIDENLSAALKEYSKDRK